MSAAMHLTLTVLSEATLEKFIQAGFIHEYADIFHLEEHRDAIVEMEVWARSRMTI